MMRSTPYYEKIDYYSTHKDDEVKPGDSRWWEVCRMFSSSWDRHLVGKGYHGYNGKRIENGQFGRITTRPGKGRKKTGEA